LADLAARHGVHLTDQVSLRFTDLSRIGALMARLRADPPTTLAGGSVQVTDLLPEADVLRLTGAGLRVVVRPSGTEPKLKAYLEVTEPVPDPAGLPAAQDRARTRLADLHTEVTAMLTD
jgi:phosphomannomutase